MFIFAMVQITYRFAVTSCFDTISDSFDTISDSFCFLLSHILEFSDVVFVFPKIKKCLRDWRANVIHYFEHFRSYSLDILVVNTDTSVTLQSFY